MLIQIFKLISSLLLVGVLFVLITNREFIIQPKETIPSKTNTKTYTTHEELTPPLPTLAEKDTTTVVAKTEETVPGTTSTQITSPTVAKIKTIPKKSLYIPMEEGQSDTDTSYRPVVSPCKVTMGYRIGRFDSNFGITQAAFIEEIEIASALWGNQLGKKLFAYNQNGPLTVNLIYDERQARTIDVNNIALEIQNSKDAAESLKNVYEKEKIIYLGDGEQLTKDSEAFKARYQVYTDKVTMYNKQGGAPHAIYEEMTRELEALKQLSKDLTTRRDVLVVYMETINAKVTKYNELVAYINSLIEKSNSLGAKKFTEGRFVPSTNSIDIYQYNDLIKLRRVVTHELGHVLGINHTENIYSIMYAVNSATTTELEPEDIAALHTVCPL